MERQNIIFGIRPIIEAIESGQEIEKVYVRKEAEGYLMNSLKEICTRKGIRMQFVPIEKLNYFTRANHQGAVAQIAPIEYAEISDIVADIPEDKIPLIMVCDGVTDVRNFGAIARSAACAGADAIIIGIKNSAPVNADAIKTSAGALTTLPVCRVGSIRNTLKYLQAQGMQLVASTEKGEKLLFETDLTKPSVIIMGSEDTGISKEVLKMCDARVAIPIVGPIESLNVSAAAAIMLFDAVRQRIELN
ncbi:MAG: 23S rRNA (guanosine(2251)-2'-O)-methyltransferase RlmB [Rikenellaceae bacterium]